MKSQFDALLEDMAGQGELIKGMSAAAVEGDEKIAAAAKDSGVEAPAETSGAGEGGEMADEDDEVDPKAKKPVEGDEPMMTKSFMLTLDDGTEVEATDGTELVKALMQRLDTVETKSAEALGGAVGLIKSQGELIKSLQGQVSALAGQGRGRKTVLAIAEKPAAGVTATGVDEPKVMAGEEFLNKCLEAQKAGSLSGLDVVKAENMIWAGQQPPAHVIAAVAALG